MARLSRWTWVAVLVCACWKPVGLEGRACPCGEGWQCCIDENVCVRPEERCVPPFAPNPLLADLADGEALDLGPYTCTSAEAEPADTCFGGLRNASLVYDRRAHLAYFTGGGYQNGMSDALRVFDPRTLRWRDAYASTPCSLMTKANFDADAGAWVSGPAGPYPRPVAAETYDEAVMLTGRREYVLFHRDVNPTGTCASPEVGGQGRVAIFSLDAGTWRFPPVLAEARPESSSSFLAAELDPPTGKVLLLADEGLWVFDPVDETKAQVLGRFPFPIGYGNSLVFFPPTGRHYSFDRISKRVLELQVDREALFRSELRIVTSPDSGTFPASRMPGFAYDEVNQVLVGGITAGTLSVFDPTTASFTTVKLTTRSSQPIGDLASQLLFYDPVNRVFFAVTDEGVSARTWAFRLKR